MKRSLQAVAMSAALFILPLTGWAQGSDAMKPLDSAERSTLFPSRAMLETGRNIANSACANCHGLNGHSTGPGVPHLAGQRAVYLHRILKAYQNRARSNEEMNHAIGFLNEDALIAVAAFYANLTPARPEPVAGEEPGAVQAGTGDPFSSIHDDMKKCVKCHGADGNASASGMPNLTAQGPDYFIYSMKAYSDGSRSHRLMEKLVTGMDDEILGKMAVFYAVQKPARTETTGDGNANDGQEIAQSCGSCHGDDGNASGANMPTLAGQDARYFVKAMKAYKDGKRKHEQMYDAVASLSDTEVENLAAFYAAQEPLRRDVRTPLTTAEWINRCERCHGIDGNSTDPRFPMLAGQEKVYLTDALKSYAGTQRADSAMHAMSDPLSQADVERIVDYYSAQEPKSVVYMQLPCEDAEND